jgi:hypothetical protein
MCDVEWDMSPEGKWNVTFYFSCKKKKSSAFVLYSRSKLEIKCRLCLIKHNATKTYWTLQLQPNVFFNFVIRRIRDEEEWEDLE